MIEHKIDSGIKLLNKIIKLLLTVKSFTFKNKK